MHSQPSGAFELDLRTLLQEEHTRLDRLFDKLVMALRVDDRQLVAETWAAFDVGLRVHMDVEEQLIVPALQRANPVEAAAILREHEEIRRRLREIGVDVDLHVINGDAITDFIRTLRAHAYRENVVMYRWASEHLDERTQGTIRASVRRVASALRRRDVTSDVSER